jgi:Flp pilus assembly protein TadB
MNSFIDNHSTVLRILLLTAIFLSGYIDAFLKMRDLASVTWFIGLGALTVWIVYPLTTIRICIGAIVFVSGIILIIIYYRGAKRDKEDKRG